MTATNEMVKHEGAFNKRKGPNTFVYEEKLLGGSFTKNKSSLISAGFAYTEIIVPHMSTPNPDHDTITISKVKCVKVETVAFVLRSNFEESL